MWIAGGLFVLVVLLIVALVLALAFRGGGGEEKGELPEAKKLKARTNSNDQH